MQHIIKPPKGCSFQDIKSDIQIIDGKIVVKLTYPNGFVITDNFDGETHSLITSGELIDLGNGIFQVPN